MVGLGANLGNRLENLAAAVRAMRAVPGVLVRRCSPVYKTAPVGFRFQPWFYNAAVLVETTMTPPALWRSLVGIEDALGRRRWFPGGPRTVDCDLLLFGGRRVVSGGLTVPHPRFVARRFAIVPAMDVGGDRARPRGMPRLGAVLRRLRKDEPVLRLPAKDQRCWRRLTRGRAGAG